MTPWPSSWSLISAMGEAALVEVALLRRLIGGQNVVGRYPGPVGEPGVVIHIKRIDRVVGIDPIPGAENGCGLITAVVGEEALIHQREQHPVGKVHADNGIHGPVGIIGQDHGLIRQGILLRGVRVILHKDGIPRGHIGAVLFYGIGICSCSSGASTRIALAILAVQSAGFALFYFLQKSQKKTKVSFLSFRYLY